MKNLDIEKLERKNIYTAPDHFFDDIQARVLQETLPKKQAKVIKMNWAYAAAAAVALIFGVTFFVTQDGESINTISKEQSLTAVNNTEANALSESESHTEARIAYQTLENDLTSVAAVNRREDREPLAVSAKTGTSAAVQNKVNAPNPEVQVDQILASFTSAELADLGKNTEQDIYLDLYY